ncbi:MAG TPA: hypothetical protein VEU30_01810 [Thermoanaerobaculia bacterium]|nr:hypothetical protein [Thermoanaerobaculia bacterium]
MKRALIAFLAVMMIAGAAFAQGGGRGPGGDRGRGDEGFGGPGGHLLIADNGTVFVTRTVTDSAAGTATTEIRAISTSGATLWTASLANRGGRLVVSGNNLLSVADASTATSTASTVTAISIASGATAWTLNVPGRVGELEPFSGGTYATVVTPPATEGASATRSLIAISSSGAILWTVNL